MSDLMKLPTGKTCSDCLNWRRCKGLISSLTGKETSCDFSPSKFAQFLPFQIGAYFIHHEPYCSGEEWVVLHPKIYGRAEIIGRLPSRESAIRLVLSRYRPFGNAEEFKPHCRRVLRSLEQQNHYLIPSFFNDYGCARDGLTYAMLLDAWLFDDDGSPCGVHFP